MRRSIFFLCSPCADAAGPPDRARGSFLRPGTPDRQGTRQQHQASQHSTRERGHGASSLDCSGGYTLGASPREEPASRVQGAPRLRIIAVEMIAVIVVLGIVIFLLLRSLIRGPSRARGRGGLEAHGIVLSASRLATSRSTINGMRYETRGVRLDAVKIPGRDPYEVSISPLIPRICEGLSRIEAGPPRRPAGPEQDHRRLARLCVRPVLIDAIPTTNRAAARDGDGDEEVRELHRGARHWPHHGSAAPRHAPSWNRSPTAGPAAGGCRVHFVRPCGGQHPIGRSRREPAVVQERAGRDWHCDRDFRHERGGAVGGGAGPVVRRDTDGKVHRTAVPPCPGFTVRRLLRQCHQRPFVDKLETRYPARIIARQ